MIRTQIYLTQPQADAFKRLTTATELTFTELLRRAIDHFLANPDVTYPLPEPLAVPDKES